MPRYATIEKYVGETPLEATTRLRARLNLDADVPLAYAGRLDPMASGKLLVLIGETCKEQKHFHGLDKEYVFEVLFGVRSDTDDVLGLVQSCTIDHVKTDTLKTIARDLRGVITLPYPHFSSKTVAGKPLFLWALEGRLGEIDVPTRTSYIYALTLEHVEHVPIEVACLDVRRKIAQVTRVEEVSKALGADFRRAAVLKSWDAVEEECAGAKLQIARFSCIASSGTYMRTLARIIGERAGTCALAYSIHRTTIGIRTHFGPLSFWRKKF